MIHFEVKRVSKGTIERKSSSTVLNVIWTETTNKNKEITKQLTYIYKQQMEGSKIVITSTNSLLISKYVIIFNH